MLRIMHAPPVEGERKLICKTDEARVSRIHGRPPYGGMVERLQRVERKHGKVQNFMILMKNEQYASSGLIGQHEPLYHVIKFLALGMARAIFPDNIVNVHELRFFTRRGKLYAATYSDFVPDESGVVERLRAVRVRYNRAKTREADLRIIGEADEEERRLNPNLGELVEKIEKGCGILLAHPEANYHMSDGKIVFFEANGLDFGEMLEAGIVAAQGTGSHLALDMAVWMLSAYTSQTSRTSTVMDDLGLCHDAFLRLTLTERTRRLVITTLKSTSLRRTRLVGFIREMLWYYERLGSEGRLELAPEMEVFINSRVLDMKPGE